LSIRSEKIWTTLICGWKTRRTKE